VYTNRRSERRVLKHCELAQQWLSAVLTYSSYFHAWEQERRHQAVGRNPGIQAYQYQQPRCRPSRLSSIRRRRTAIDLSLFKDAQPAGCSMPLATVATTRCTLVSIIINQTGQLAVPVSHTTYN